MAMSAEDVLHTDVLIVGAGPYGLSLAAHLAAAGVGHRIFGRPMETWLTHMPEGMCLKSEGFASSLSDPAAAQTLARFSHDHGLPYQPTGLPVPLETFQRYGLDFAERCVPDLDTRHVALIERDAAGFTATLEDGATVRARRVVLAVGISHYAHLPDAIAGLPRDLVSHTATAGDLARFAGKRVAVLGAGASALDAMKLLLEAGAQAELVARTPRIRFHAPPTGARRSLWERLRAPMSGLGPGWRSRACTDAPLLFHLLPARFRAEVVRRHLGPAPCWWTNDAAVRAAPFHLGMRLRSADATAAGLTLHLTDAAGEPRQMAVDHLIAGTGYRIAIDRLRFLSPAIREAIRTEAEAPVLDWRFGSSVPGLYFVGLSAAPGFGPMLRFAYGAGFAARHLTRHLRRTRARHPAPTPDARPPTGARRPVGTVDA